MVQKPPCDKGIEEQFPGSDFKIRPSRLWGDLEGDAEVVGAAVRGCAEDVALAVDDYTYREVAVRAAEFMHDDVFPWAILLRCQLEDDAAGIRAAALVASASDTVEIACLVQYQRTVRQGSVGPVGKAVHHRLFPVAAGEGELEDRAVSLVPAKLGGSVEVSGGVHHQAAVWGLAVCGIGGEAVQDVVGPGAVPVGRHLENDSATVAGPAGWLTDSAVSGGAKQIAFAVPDRRSRG